MRRRFWRQPALALTVALAGGCTTPHHSNALIFGTNTSFGIDVSQTAAGTPGIVVGYKRQEAVFMPLVATEKFDENGIPTPCAVTPRIIDGDMRHLRIMTKEGEPILSPCFLVGRNGGALDTYSVLASFGAEFSASGTQPEASGGLAQFFATGLAAQTLAIRGGSSLVATGGAATEAAKADTTGAIAALYDAPEVLALAASGTTVTKATRTSLVDYLQNSTNDDNFRKELTDLETAAGQPGLFSNTGCAAGSKADCLTFMQSSDGYGAISLFRDALEKAVKDRKTARGLP